MEEPEVQTGFVTQADLKLLRDQVDQLQVILTEPRKPWYLEGSTLTSALAVLVALISFFFSTYQGDQKELREKREEFRGLLEKLLTMSEDVDRLETEEPDSPVVRRKISTLIGSVKLYRSSAEKLAQDLGANVLFIEYLIIGDAFRDDSRQQSKTTEYYKKALEAKASSTERNIAFRRLATLQILPPYKDVTQMRYYFTLAINEVKGEVDDLRFSTGRTYEDWAVAERSLNNYKEYWKRQDLAEQAYLKISDDYKKDEALAALRRRLRPIPISPPWASAPPSSLGPAPLWRSPLLDDAIKNLGREAPASGSRGTQP